MRPSLLLPLLLFACLLPLGACSQKPALPAACDLKPESGKCRAAIGRYYFDPRRGECRVFIWGGCEGVAPFETFEDCHAQCRPGVPSPETIPSLKAEPPSEIPAGDAPRDNTPARGTRP